MSAAQAAGPLAAAPAAAGGVVLRADEAEAFLRPLEDADGGWLRGLRAAGAFTAAAASAACTRWLAP